MRTQGFASDTFSKKNLCLTVIVLAAVFFSITPAHSQSSDAGKKAAAVDKTSITAGYANFPVSFEPNVGQSQSPVKFLAHASGYSLFLTPDETVFLLRETQKSDQKAATDVFHPLRGSIL